MSIRSFLFNNKFNIIYKKNQMKFVLCPRRYNMFVKFYLEIIK